jgi:hypothetical protein
MLRGEHNPVEPKKPPKVHIQNFVVVPYTPHEMEVRMATYRYKKDSWDKTKKVHNTKNTPRTHMNDTLYLNYTNIFINNALLMHYTRI